MGGWDWWRRALRCRGAVDEPCWNRTACGFPSHCLTHSLAAAQAGGIAPKEVAARTLRLAPPTPQPSGPQCSLRASIRGVPSANLLAFSHVCLSSGKAPLGGGGHVCRFGPCMYVQDQLCMRGGSLCVSLLGCTCVARRGERGLGIPGSLVWRWGASSLLKPAGCEPLALGSRAGPGEGN